MYPYIRAAWMIWRGRRMPKMDVYDTHVSHHRAWPWDTDMFGELNNGRILTLFELGRWQSLMRTELAAPFWKERMTIAVAGASVRYRKRIAIFQTYRIQTRVLGYDDRFVYVEQSMWVGDTPCHHILMRAAFRKGGQTVPPRRFLEMANLPTAQPGFPAWAGAWSEADAERPWPPNGGPVYEN